MTKKIIWILCLVLIAIACIVLFYYGWNEGRAGRIQIPVNTENKR